MRQHPAGLFERRLVNDHQRIYRKVHSLRFLGIVAELHGELRYVLPSGEHDIVFMRLPLSMRSVELDRTRLSSVNKA